LNQNNNADKLSVGVAEFLGEVAEFMGEVDL
jgi:hypothetical protein